MITSRIAKDNHGVIAPVVDGVAVRADALAVPDDGRGKAFLVDVTGVHDTTKYNTKKQFKYHVALQRRTNGVFVSNHHLASNKGDSPAVDLAVKLKRKKYGLIESLANIQAAGFGPALPLKFVAAVITHRCEMASEFINFIEYCVGRYKSRLRITPDIDGNSPAKAGALFRGQFKTDICVQVAKGFGQQLLATVNMSLSASASL